MSRGALPVPVIYEDNHLLVVCKPPNLPTQADASGDADLQNEMKRYLAEKYAKPGAVYLGIVHRLDRPVGGLVVLARTSKAAERLSVQVREKTMNREYLAIVEGGPEETVTLRDYLVKDSRTNTVTVCRPNTPGAKEAILTCTPLTVRDGRTLVRVRLYTGRSHQIRVQLSHAGYPIWGDARYGGGRPGEQIALWGAFLTLMHPTKRESMTFFASPPVTEFPWNAFAGEIAALIPD